MTRNYSKLAVQIFTSKKKRGERGREREGEREKERERNSVVFTAISKSTLLNTTC